MPQDDIQELDDVQQQIEATKRFREELAAMMNSKPVVTETDVVPNWINSQAGTGLNLPSNNLPSSQSIVQPSANPSPLSSRNGLMGGNPTVLSVSPNAPQYMPGPIPDFGYPPTVESTAINPQQAAMAEMILKSLSTVKPESTVGTDIIPNWIMPRNSSRYDLPGVGKDRLVESTKVNTRQKEREAKLTSKKSPIRARSDFKAGNR